MLMSRCCLNAYTETSAAVPDLAWGLLALSLHKYTLPVKAYLTQKGERAISFRVFLLTLLTWVVNILVARNSRHKQHGTVERENEASLLCQYMDK